MKYQRQELLRTGLSFCLLLAKKRCRKILKYERHSSALCIRLLSPKTLAGGNRLSCLPVLSVFFSLCSLLLGIYCKAVQCMHI